MYSFKKLWALLEKRNISIKEFMEQTGISKFYIKKLKEDYYVNWIVLIKICKYLNCNYSDILDIVAW